MQFFFKKNAFLPLLPISPLKHAFLGVVWHQKNESGTSKHIVDHEFGQVVWHQENESGTNEVPNVFPGGVWHQENESGTNEVMSSSLRVGLLRDKPRRPCLGVMPGLCCVAAAEKP